MFRTLGKIALFLILAAIVCATVVPIGMRPKTGHVILERTLAYLLLGGAAGVLWPRRPIMVMCAAVVFACALEFSQKFIPTRDAGLIDALEKSVGAIGGVLLGSLLARSIAQRGSKNTASRRQGGLKVD